MTFPLRPSHAGAEGEAPDGSQSPLSPLVYAASVGAGVRIGVDLMAPWRRPAPDNGDGPLPSIPIAERVADQSGPTTCPRSAEQTPPDAQPWMRAAFVEAVHRWSILPMDQSVVDAERGVSRHSVAATLPSGTMRAEVVGDALRLARQASHGLTGLLRALARHPEPVPDPLLDALRHLTEGYSTLAAEVKGPDRELAAVLDGWRQLSRRSDAAWRPASPEEVPRTPFSSTRSSMIDPRQVQARVLALSTDPSVAEISVIEGPGDVVHIRVPAFGREVDLDVVARLTARLVDQKTGNAKGHALLTWVDGQQTGTPVFEATVPLCGLDIEDVRADVFDAHSDVPPAPNDSNEAMQDARSAVVFLAEWRRLACLAELGNPTIDPVRTVRDLTVRLRPRGAAATIPIFAGGPSPADLDTLADLGARRLLERIRRAQGTGLLALTGGAAGLLVAELAAIHLGSKPARDGRPGSNIVP